MVRRSKYLALSFAAALLVFGGLGFARASVAEFDRATASGFVPSIAPSLLGPINELGRNGWQCIPERAARAKTARDAELPAEAEH